MKKHLLTCSFLGVFLIAVTGSCKKGVKDPVTIDKAAGTWSINSIRYSASYGTATTKDSTVPWQPILGNNVTFDGVSKMEYCFNLPYTNNATYKLDGTDSITITFDRNNRVDGIDSLLKIFGNETSRWKILLLTSTNFNLEKTFTDNKAFPGASSVVTFQSFVR